MTYTDFAGKMLLALYQESEIRSNPQINFGDLARWYGLPANERWMDRLSDEWGADGLAAVRSHVGSPLGWQVEITGRGMRRIEDNYGDKEGVGEILERVETPPPNVITTEAGEPLVTEDGAYIVTEEPVRASPEEIPTIVSSEAWTGIEKRLQRDVEAVNRIKEQLVQLDREIENLGLTNQERAKVKAITEALAKLVESPEPEWKAIVELLRSPTLAAVLGLAGIVQIILKVIFGIG